MSSVPPDLVTKYDRPGPRYTSYPTAAQFHPGVRSAEYRAALAEVPAGEPLSAYVHVPFCEHRCTYCGCYVIPTPQRSIATKYLEYCRKEIALVRDRLASPARIGTIHLGGGTPTFLRPDELRSLLSTILSTFEPVDGCEISVEVDPRVTAPEHLDVLREVGANRLSLGVQDTSPEVQEAIGRNQSREVTESFYSLVREKGFDSVNLDLVYGLPLQTEERFRETLRDVLALRPERFAIFGYAHVPWIRPHQERIDEATLPRANERLSLYLLAHESLTAAGYRHIGMDHFALPGDDLSIARDEGRLGRNFMGYTPRREVRIIGIGISSIGDLGAGYFQNEKKLSTYFERVDAGELPVERGYLLERDDILRRRTIHDILCAGRVDREAFRVRWGVRFEDYFATELRELLDLERDGLVRVDDRALAVTPLGELFLRNIAMPFDRHLRERPPATATYSRTV